MKNTAYYLTLIFLVAGILLTTNTSHAQSQFSNDWALVKELNGVKIYTKLESCDRSTRDEQMVFVKVENTTDKAAIVHYHLNQYYDGQCKTCDDPQGEYSAFVDLGANAQAQGGCGYAAKGLSAFAGWENGNLMLSNLEFVNLEIRFEGSGKIITDKKQEISRAEYEAMPDAKKKHIDDNPDKYVIK